MLIHNFERYVGFTVSIVLVDRESNEGTKEPNCRC